MNPLLCFGGIRNSEFYPIFYWENSRDEKFRIVWILIRGSDIHFIYISFSANFRRNVRTYNEKKFPKQVSFFTRKNQLFLRLFSVFALNFSKMEHHILVWKAFTAWLRVDLRNTINMNLEEGGGCSSDHCSFAYEQ